MYMNEAQSVPVVPDASLYPHEALISDDQSLFDSNYEPFKPTKNQKVDGGSWGSNKRSLDSTDRDAPSPKRAYPAPNSEFLERSSSPAPVVPSSQDFDKRVIVPADPMCWTKEHVKQWIQWAIKEFSLRDIDVDCFDMTGKDLCKLTREDFLKLAPAYNGDILMAHLCVLRRTPLPNLTSEDIDRALAPSVATSSAYPGSHYNTATHYDSRSFIPASESSAYADRSSTSWPSGSQNTERSSSSSTWSAQNQTNRLTHMKDSMAIVPTRSISNSPQLQGSYSANALAVRTDNNAGSGQIQLWQFLLELLSDPKNSHFIAWEGTNGEFKLIDPDEVARRWGERKNKPNMNYDKLSRALRYYYDKNIMSKIHGKRYAYKFDFHGLAQLNQPITSDAQAHAQAVYKFPGADFYPGFASTSFYPGAANPSQYWSSQYWTRAPAPQSHNMYSGPLRALPYYA